MHVVLIAGRQMDSFFTFQMSVVQSLVEVLLLFVQELDFLVYSEFDCVGCGFAVLLFSSIDLDVDAVGF
jgi:hypothetical protein